MNRRIEESCLSAREPPPLDILPLLMTCDVAVALKFSCLSKSLQCVVYKSVSRESNDDFPATHLQWERWRLRVLPCATNVERFMGSMKVGDPVLWFHLVYNVRTGKAVFTFTPALVESANEFENASVHGVGLVTGELASFGQLRGYPKTVITSVRPHRPRALESRNLTTLLGL
jgi:hypothetical protein